MIALIGNQDKRIFPWFPPLEINALVMMAPGVNEIANTQSGALTVIKFLTSKVDNSGFTQDSKQ